MKRIFLSKLNQEEFEGMEDELRVQYEGFRPGMYVRIEVEGLSCEFIENFDPSYPVILGGLLAGEDNIGYIQVRKTIDISLFVTA